VWFATTAPAVVMPRETLFDIEMKTIASKSGACSLTLWSTLEAGAKVVSTRRSTFLPVASLYFVKPETTLPMSGTFMSGLVGISTKRTVVGNKSACPEGKPSFLASLSKAELMLSSMMASPWM